MPNKSAIIFANGQDKNSKALSNILFKPSINWSIDFCHDADIKNICVVTDGVFDLFKKAVGDDALIAVQETSICTGHCTMTAKDFLNKNIDGDVIVIYGDVPFMDTQTINKSYDMHKNEGNEATIIAVNENNKIVSCAYWFNVKFLMGVVPELLNSQENIPLTQAIEIMMKKGGKINTYVSQNSEIALKINSNKDLLKMNNIAKQHVIDMHIENGVEFVSLDGIIISPEVKIGKGTVILPGTILRGNTSIGEDCTIGPNSLVENSIIADRTKFNASQCYNSTIESDVSIGPFCHIRPNSHILDGVHLGDFVEIKNSTIGEKTHVSHLTYVGDSDVGKRVNFGCGVVTVNYNGKSKARCTIGDDAFIGCNTNLVAPVTVGDKGYTAAGSTITDNVPDDSLAIARARQVNKEGYNKKLRG